MRLLKFVTLFAMGGTERQFVNLALSLDRSRVDVRFGCLRKWGQLVACVEERGIAIDDYGVTSFRSPRVLRAQLRLARNIRRNRIEIVHAYNFYANVFALPAAKLAGARTIASIRDMGAYLSPMQRRMQRVACRFADHILVNAEAIREWLVSDGYNADRITVIPNGIDMTRFQPREETVDSPVVGYIGRIERGKGLEDLLAAAAIIVRENAKVRFVVAGVANDAAYMTSIEALAASLGIRDRVSFAGYRDDVPRILSQLSVSVLPSLSEGLSNTLLESMAAGAPTVATRVGGTVEAMRDGENGLLVKPSDPHALAAAIQTLLRDRSFALHLASAARQTVADRFSMSRMVERTTHIYEHLAAQPRGEAHLKFA
jgi:glycosyltransferase involved in cell wall biosynthesis